MIVIGADESGTGAWAGPFTVCALAVREEDFGLIKRAGAKDSKVMSDGARRVALTSLIDIALIGKCEVVEVGDITKLGQKVAWRAAMFRAITYVAEVVGKSATVVIDGNHDVQLSKRLISVGMKGSFRPRADANVPAVSAASVIAKTVRNDLMSDLHHDYPEYGWAANSGYGTPEHNMAIQRYGKTLHHRPVKNLIDVPLRPTVVVNLRMERHDVYIGRSGKGEDGYFGNPVIPGHLCPVCGDHHFSPGATIPCYRTYLYQRVQSDTVFAARLERLRHRRLGCFCRPGPCHGDVIVEYLDRAVSVP